MKYYSSLIVVAIIIVFNAFAITVVPYKTQNDHVIIVPVPYNQLPFVAPIIFNYPDQVRNGPYFGTEDFSASASFAETPEGLLLSLQITDNRIISHTMSGGDTAAIRFYRNEKDFYEVKLLRTGNDTFEIVPKLPMSITQKGHAAEIIVRIPGNEVQLFRSLPTKCEINFYDDDGINHKTITFADMPFALLRASEKDTVLSLQNPGYVPYGEPIMLNGEYFGPAATAIITTPNKETVALHLDGNGAFSLLCSPGEILQGNNLVSIACGNLSTEIDFTALHDPNPFFSIKTDTDRKTLEAVRSLKRIEFLSTIDSYKRQWFLGNVKKGASQTYLIIFTDYAEAVGVIPALLASGEEYYCTLQQTMPTIMDYYDIADMVRFCQSQDKTVRLILWGKHAEQWLPLLGNHPMGFPLALVLLDSENVRLSAEQSVTLKNYDIHAVINMYDVRKPIYPEHVIIHKTAALTPQEYLREIKELNYRNKTTVQLSSNSLSNNILGPISVYDRIGKDQDYFAVSLNRSGAVWSVFCNNISFFQIKTDKNSIIALNGAEATVQPNAKNSFVYDTGKKEWTIYSDKFPVLTVFSDIFSNSISAYKDSGSNEAWMKTFGRPLRSEGKVILCVKDTMPYELAQRFSIKIGSNGIYSTTGEYLAYEKKFMATFANSDQILVYTNVWQPEYLQFPYSYILFNDDMTIDSFGKALPQ